MSDTALAARLRGIVAFLPEFERADFHFGHWVPSRQDAEGLTEMGYYHLSDRGAAFVEAAYDHGWVIPFAWSDWKGTPEAERLRDDRTALSHASVAQIERLLTTLIRQDRFAEGTLGEAFKAGLLTSILRRAAQLLRGPDADRDGAAG